MQNREQAFELYAQIVATEVFEKAARTVFRLLEHGPTSPNSSDTIVQQLLALHHWFQTIPSEDEEWTRTVVIEAIWSAFHAFCYFFDSGAFWEISEGRDAVFSVYMETYETEDLWLSRKPPTERVRVSPVEEGVMLQDLEWEQMVFMARRNHWETFIGIERELSSASGTPPNPSEPFAVGTYSQLRRKVPGTCLEAHHVPSGYAAQQVIPNYHYETAPSILLTVDMHYILHRTAPPLYEWQEGLEEGWSRLDHEKAAPTGGGLPVGVVRGSRLDYEKAALLFMHAQQEEIFKKATEEILGILSRGSALPSGGTGDSLSNRTWRLHRWFTALSELDKQNVLAILRYTTEIAFHALCYFWDGGVHIHCGQSEEVEFAVYLELYEGNLPVQGTENPVQSIRVCPMKGDGFDLHEILAYFYR